MPPIALSSYTTCGDTTGRRKFDRNPLPGAAMATGCAALARAAGARYYPRRAGRTP
jgi:hypothetical protein